MDLVEFALVLRMPSGGAIQKFGAEANAVITKLISSNKLLEKSYSELEKQIKKVENTIRNSKAVEKIRDARKELEKLQQQAARQEKSGSFGNSKFGLFGVLGEGIQEIKGMGWAGKAVGIAAKGADSAVNSSLEREETVRQMQQATGDKNSGTALVRDLSNLQKATILGKEVFKNAQTMLNSGFDSTEIVKNIQMLGNVAMGDVGRLNMLTTVFSQIRETGKLTSQDLSEMVSVGFNPLEQISISTGKSMAELEKEVEKGLISFDLIKKAFEDATSAGGAYQDILGKMGDTPAGKLMQLGNIVDELKIKAGDALMPLVDVALKLGLQIFPHIETVIAPLAEMIQLVAGYISEALGNMFGWLSASDNSSGSIMYCFNVLKSILIEFIIPYFGKLYNTIGKIVGGVLEFLNTCDILRDVFDAIYLLAGGVFTVVSAVADALGVVFDTIIKPLLNGISWVYNLIRGKLNPGGVKFETSAENNVSEQKTVYFELEENNTGKLPLSSLVDFPQIPETPERNTTQLLSDIAKNTQENKEMAADLGTSVAEGGPKIINFTIPKFLDNIIINSSTLTEGAENIERIFQELFGRVIAQGAITS